MCISVSTGCYVCNIRDRGRPGREGAQFFHFLACNQADLSELATDAFGRLIYLSYRVRDYARRLLASGDAGRPILRISGAPGMFRHSVRPDITLLPRDWPLRHRGR